MPQICILTDSTVIFDQPSFPGNELVNIIPFYIQIGQQTIRDDTQGQNCSKFIDKSTRTPIIALPPTVNDFCQIFQVLGENYHSVVAILSSSQLYAVCTNAIQAVQLAGGGAQIHVIDSQTVAAGLGFLVEAAAKAALQDVDVTEIKSLVRALIPHTYTLFCFQSLTYLSRSGYLDPAQAIVGELMGIVPLYVLENGSLVSILKARSTRHLVDVFQEFISEFEHLKHISIVQGYQPYEQEAKNLRERLSQLIPAESISEHTFSTALNATFGPRSLGVFTLEH